MKCKYYEGVYETADFVQLSDCIENMKGATLILDIGKPSKIVLEQMISEMCRICTEREQLVKKLLIRVQSKYVLEQFAKADVKFCLAYYIPTQEVCEKKDITPSKVATLCKKYKVKWVTMPKEALREEVVEELHGFNIKVCVFSFNTLTGIEEALDMGVDLVGTHHMSIKMLRKL